MLDAFIRPAVERVGDGRAGDGLGNLAVVDPFVDFAALDVVGVAVDPDTESDRAVFKAGGAR